MERKTTPTAPTNTPGQTLLYGSPAIHVAVMTLTKPGTFHLNPSVTTHWLIIRGGGALLAGDTPKILNPADHLVFDDTVTISVEPTDPLEILTVQYHPENNNTALHPIGPVTEERPWGSYTVIVDEPHYKLKQLLVTPGERLSGQYHHKREEHWFTVSGYPLIELGQTEDSSKIVKPEPGAYVNIPTTWRHRLDNRHGDTVAELIELQLGSYFGEDDIVRDADDYGR